MKKHYSLLLVMLLGLLGFSASARPVSITVEGDGTVLWGFWGDVTHELHSGLNEFDWDGTYYFINQEGSKIESFMDTSSSTPSAVDTDRYNPRYYTFYVNGNRATPMSFTIVVKKVAEGEDSVYFLLENGSASVYRENKTLGGSAFFEQDLTVGQPAKLPLVDGHSYFIVAGEGLDLDVVNAAGVAQPTDYDTKEFNRYVSKVNASESNTYTITTKQASAKQDSYDITFNIKGGNAVELRHTEYVSGTPNTTKETITNGQTKNFPANDTWAVYPIGDDEFVKVTDGDGNNVELWSSNAYFMINTTQPPVPSVYNIELKASVTAGVTFNLVSGNASAYLAADASKRLLAEFLQTLTVGENLLPLREDGRQYAIVAGENQKMTVVNASNNSNVFVNDANEIFGYTGEWVAVNSNAVATYNITTEETAASYDVTFNISGGETIELKQLFTDPTWHYELYRTVNNGETVTLPKGENFYIYAPAGSKLISVTDASGNNVSIAEPGTADARVQISTFDVPSTAYNVVLEVETPVADKFIVNVDNASRVSMSTANYQPVALVSGKNLLEPGVAYSFYGSGGAPLVSVTLNGTPLTSSYGFYNLTAEQTAAGNVLDIVANYPDVDYTYTFVYPTDGPVWDKAYWEDETFEKHEIAIVNNSITVHAGRNVLLYALDPKNWKDVTITLPDGSTTEWYDMYTDPGEDPVQNASFFATMPSGNITTDATAINKIVYTDVIVNVAGDATLLTASYGDATSTNAFTNIASLNAGANTVRIPEGNSIRFATKNGGVIETVTFKANTDTETANATKNETDGTFLAGPFSQGGEVNVTMGEPETPQIYFSLKVNDPSAIVVKYYNSKSVLTTLNAELTEGVNNLSVPQDEGRIFVQMQVSGVSAANDIKSVKYRKSADLDWTIARLAGNNTYDVYVYVDCQNEIEVEVNKLDIDKKCTVFTDYGVNHGVKLVSAEGRSVSLTGGYQTFDFGESENPFKVEASNPTVTPKVFVNGEMIEGTEVTLVEGALVKIFTGSIEPLAFSFNITAKKDQNDDVKVADMMIDGRTPVEDPTKPLELLYGTEVSFTISAPEDVTYTVKYGDDALQANDYGVYTLWVRAAGAVEIVYTYTGEQPPVEETHLYLVGEVSGNEMKPAFELTEGESSWTASIGELYGKFRIKSEDNSVNLGSNGNPVELNVPYTPTEGAAADMELACGSITDVKISVAKDGYTITITGTVGIAAISRDALDSNAIYFDLQGRRISTENVANGIYIQVANGQTRKIAVK